MMVVGLSSSWVQDQMYAINPPIPKNTRTMDPHANKSFSRSNMFLTVAMKHKIATMEKEIWRIAFAIVLEKSITTTGIKPQTPMIMTHFGTGLLDSLSGLVCGDFNRFFFLVPGFGISTEGVGVNSFTADGTARRALQAGQSMVCPASSSGMSKCWLQLGQGIFISNFFEAYRSVIHRKIKYKICNSSQKKDKNVVN